MAQQLEIDYGEDLQFGDSPDARSELVNSDPEAVSPEDRNCAESLPVAKGPKRIKQLERALEQCQLYINELKSQLVAQDFLEMQLASTEEFAHIQKQAIVALKHQLEAQEQRGAEYDVLMEQKVSLETQLSEAEAQVHNQQSELSTLRDQREQDRETLDHFKDQEKKLADQIQDSQDAVVRETQQRIIAQQTVERLRSELLEREGKIGDLEASLKTAKADHEKITADLDSHRAIISAFQESDASKSPKNHVIKGLSSTLLEAQAKIATLESQLSNQSVLQAQLQHSTQEYESKAQDSQERSSQLEKQVTEMQEEILRQAQQAHEYETAIQHWKDRSLRAEKTVGQMKQALEYVLSDRRFADVKVSPELATTITEITNLMSPTTAQVSLPDNSNRKSIKLDLPALMNRWRNERS